MLDEKLLEEATRLSAQRTYSKTVDLALAEFVRRARAGRILELAGAGLWEGDLAAIRRDAPGRGPGGRARVLLLDTSAWIEVFAKPARLTFDELGGWTRS